MIQDMENFPPLVCACVYLCVLEVGGIQMIVWASVNSIGMDEMSSNLTD